MDNHPNGTPGKKPPAPSASKRPAEQMMLLLRDTREQTRIEGLSSENCNEDDYSVLDGENCVGRIYREPIQGEPRWFWFLQIVPAPPPNHGMADTLEKAKADFKRRYTEVRGTK
jgi:hypothetical protein